MLAAPAHPPSLLRHSPCACSMDAMVDRSRTVNGVPTSLADLGYSECVPTSLPLRRIRARGSRSLRRSRSPSSQRRPGRLLAGVRLLRPTAVRIPSPAWLRYGHLTSPHRWGLAHMPPQVHLSQCHGIPAGQLRTVPGYGRHDCLRPRAQPHSGMGACRVHAVSRGRRHATTLLAPPRRTQYHNNCGASVAQL